MLVRYQWALIGCQAVAKIVAAVVDVLVVVVVVVVVALAVLGKAAAVVCGSDPSTLVRASSNLYCCSGTSLPTNVSTKQ